MKDNLKKTFRYILSLAVAAVLLYFSFRGVKWEDFIHGVQECKWGYVLLSMAASIMAFWLRGLRWRQILLPIDPRITRLTTFNAVNIGYIANFVFPRIGEFVRCGVVSAKSAARSRHQGGQPATYDKVLGTVVLERCWDMLTMLFFTLAFFLLRWERFGDFFAGKIWQPISDSLDFSIWWIVALILVAAVLGMWAVWYFRDRNSVCDKICGICRGVLDGFTAGFRMKGKWAFILYTVLIWIMYWLMAIFTMKAIPSLDWLNVADALFLMLIGSFGWLVPVPGGFGSFHFIVSLALSSVYGISPALGVVFATLSHESQAITMALCGGISYFYETFVSGIRRQKQTAAPAEE